MMPVRSPLVAASLALATSVILTLSALPASAAGPRELRISGDCLQPALQVAFTPSGVDVMELAVALGAWFTAAAEDVVPLAADPPRGDLGEPYAVDWVFPTDNGDGVTVIRQTLYPYAEEGAIVHTPPGQEIDPVAVGWYEAPRELYPLLFELGFPQARAETCRSGDNDGLPIAIGVGLLVIASVAAFMAGHRMGQHRAVTPEESVRSD